MNRLTLLLLCPAALAAVEIDESRRTAVVRAVERAQPAVVSVHVIHREPVYVIDPFRELFFPNSPYTYRYAGEKERVTGGSGLIVTEDGQDIYVWGNDTEGQCGIGQTSSYHTLMSADPHISRSAMQVVWMPVRKRIV